MTDQPTATPPTIVNVHLDNTNYATAAATAQASAVPPARKSALVAYLALALGWLVGLHRFYLRRSPGRWLLLMWISTWFAMVFLPPVVPAAFLLLLFPLVDAFLIPGWVRRHNGEREAALALAASSTTPSAPASAGQAITPPADRPKDLRTRLLRVAHRGDGRLTLTQAVMETEADFDEVELALRALVTAGHIDVDKFATPTCPSKPRPKSSQKSSASGWRGTRNCFRAISTTSPSPASAIPLRFKSPWTRFAHASWPNSTRCSRTIPAEHVPRRTLRPFLPLPIPSWPNGLPPSSNALSATRSASGRTTAAPISTSPADPTSPR